jgi:uncharacterized membrane protein
MAKILVILIIAAIFESIGVAFLSGGLKEINGAKTMSVSEITRVIISGATNGKIVLGITLEAIFFGCLLYMLSQRDVSLIWPLTSLGFIFTTLAAVMFLGEKVSVIRWAGVLLIALGASLTSYSEATKEPKVTPPPANSSTTLRPQ